MCKIGSVAFLFVETVARDRNGHNFFLAFRTGSLLVFPFPVPHNNILSTYYLVGFVHFDN